MPLAMTQRYCILYTLTPMVPAISGFSPMTRILRPAGVLYKRNQRRKTQRTRM